jgi:hypothetical protein
LVELTDELFQRMYKDYAPIIRSDLRNQRFRDGQLIEDIVNETMVVAAENLGPLPNEDLIGPYFKRFWIFQGIKRVTKKSHDKPPVLKESQIDDFYEKVMFLVKELGYLEDEAKEYVIWDESLRKGLLLGPAAAADDHPGWLESLVQQIPKLAAIDRKLILNAIEYCLNELRQRNIPHEANRDVLVLCSIIEGEKKRDIAKKFNFKPSRVTQIRKRDMPILRRCLCGQLDLDELMDIDCEEIA